MSAFEKIKFCNTFHRLPSHFYTPLKPTPLPDPELVSVNTPLLARFGIDAETEDRLALARLGAGQLVLEGMAPLAQKYTGHQFGHYNPDLGDGRGILLGEVLDQDGQRWDWHLKGAGQTPYSRFGDGRAVLRSTIREYLASEALHALGIPSTRALFITRSPHQVMREQPESAATLVRATPTHVRFGHFEYARIHQGNDAVRQLADYTVETVYPHLQQETNPARRHEALLREVLERTAQLIADWQAFGFVHGVMNTDNMSVLGETFDYGPFAFMEAFRAGFVANHTDAGGRYAYNRQPEVGYWNCQMLVRCFQDLLPDDTLRRTMRHYETTYNSAFMARMRAKLGLEEEEAEDTQLVIGLFRLLQQEETDFTLFFRALCDWESDPQGLHDLFVDRALPEEWLKNYGQRLTRETTAPEKRQQQMRHANPRYVLRTGLAQTAIEQAENGDYTEIDRLLDVLRQPYDEQPESAHYARPSADGGRHISLSCSS
ncbi:YdiU family protein [Marinobacteraceae bacterium S3BR75-40.1]